MLGKICFINLDYDEKKLITASHDGTINFYDEENGDELFGEENIL